MGPAKEPNTYEQQLVVLGQVLQTLREAENTDFLLETTLGYLKTTFHPQYELIWIGLYDRVDHRVLGKGGCLPMDVPFSGDFLRQRLTLSSGDLIEQVVIQQRPLAVADLRQEMRGGDWRRIAQKLGIQGTMIFPIAHRDRCLGVVLLGSRHWGTFPNTPEKASLSMVLGELAMALFEAEQRWQRQQIKRPDRPLLALLQQVRGLSNLGQRLELVVEETHRFIGPARTSVYWFEPNQRYFWRRLSNHAKTAGFLDLSSPPAAGITAQEISSFYQLLLNDQVVAIGEAHSSLRADATTRLMQLIRARSLMAAPILYHRELLGFLAVEGTEARIWQEEEKQYLRGAAQLIALVAPLEQMETVIQRTHLDHALTSEIARSLYGATDWKVTITRAADLLSRRLKTERFMVLLFDKTQQHFEVCYQNQPQNRRVSGPTLPRLSPVDCQLVEQSETAVGIENLEDDLRLNAWRQPLMELGVRSLLVSRTTPDPALEGLLLVCHEMPRSWTQAERDLIRGVAQQIGLILHQWQLQKQVEQQRQLAERMQRSLANLRQCTDPDTLEQTALRSISGVLDVPLALLVSWFPGQRLGQLVLSESADRRYALNPQSQVSVHADPLLRLTLESPGPVQFTAHQIPGESRQWLSPQGIDHLLAIALRTHGETEPAGMLCLVETQPRHWSDQELQAFALLAGELAVHRRHLKLESLLQNDRLKLEQLNWYKHRQLEDLHRSTQAGVQKLLDLIKPNPDPLIITRQQQILHQMGDALAPLQSTLPQELWQLQCRQETLPLLGLVRRSMDRVDGILKERQLWSQVHHEDNSVVLGDALKLEMILYELLLSACLRSKTGGRIDIWCRQFDRRWVELAITDDGLIEPRLLQDLEGDAIEDPLSPSTLDHPPGLHLAICKELAQAMEADLSLSKLEDGRVMSRLMLPAMQGLRPN